MVGCCEHKCGKFLSSWGNILFNELLVLLNVYKLKNQFIIAICISAFCVSIWTHQLFTIFHNKIYLRYFLFYQILISYRHIIVVTITVNTELFDWEIILLCEKQLWQKHWTHCIWNRITVKEATTTNDKGKCIFHDQSSTETAVETFFRNHQLPRWSGHYPHFMKHQSSFLFSQQPLTGLYSELNKSSLQPPILFLPDISVLCSYLCTDLWSSFLP